jgi:hypothetical protein
MAGGYTEVLVCSLGVNRHPQEKGRGQLTIRFLIRAEVDRIKKKACSKSNGSVHDKIRNR